MLREKIRDKSNRYDKVYITVFSLLFCVVYLTILISGKMYIFIDIGADTYCSYWPSIAYAKGLLGDLKLWDMQLGLGASTVTYIAYFLADPFNWVCFLFKKENLDLGIFLGLALKNVCLAYYSYRYLGRKGVNDYRKVICSLMIVFSGWFVGWGQHYNFATVFVLFVAMLYYFECWMQSEKWVGLVCCTALLAIISPYYCYMALLFMVFYYFISLYYVYQTRAFQWKNFVGHALKTAGLFLLGLGCSALVFLPYMSDTLASPRVSGKLFPSLMPGTKQEYLSMLFRMFSNSILGINENFVGFRNFYECPFMYTGILTVFLIPFIFMKREKRKQYHPVILAVLFAVMFVNVSAPIFNAFSTKSYRWTFLFVPVLALGCAKGLEIFETQENKKVILWETFCFDLLLMFYLIWCYQQYGIDGQRILVVGVPFVLINIYGIMLGSLREKGYFQKALIGIVALDLYVNAFVSVHDRSLIPQTTKDTMNYFDDSNEALTYLKERDDSFYRVSKNYGQIDLNDSMFQEYNGEKLYSSILSGEMWEMMELFDLRVKNSNYFYGFDDKQILRDLAVGKYRLTKVPNEYYGYEQIHNSGDVYIYENQYAGEFGVLYDSYVLDENLEDKDPVELQSIILDACIMEPEEAEEGLENIVREQNEDSGFEMRLLEQGTDLEEMSYMIQVQTDYSGPLVLELKGENISGSVDIYTEYAKEMVADSISCTVESGTKSFYIDNLSVSMLDLNNVQGELEGYRLYEIDAEKLAERLNARMSEHFLTSYFSDTYIEGKVVCESDKLLFIPIPYNRNWQVAVNGENVKVYRADSGFMAVVIPEGENDVVMQYSSGVFRIGVFITGASLVILFMVILITSRKRKERNR